MCPEAYYLELPVCEIAYLQIIARKLKHLSLSLSTWNLLETTASFLSSESYCLRLASLDWQAPWPLVEGWWLRDPES